MVTTKADISEEKKLTGIRGADAYTPSWQPRGDEEDYGQGGRLRRDDREGVRRPHHFGVRGPEGTRSTPSLSRAKLRFRSSEAATVSAYFDGRRVIKRVRAGTFGFPRIRARHFSLTAADALGNKSRPLTG